MSKRFPEWRKLPREVRDVLATSEDFLTARTLGALRFLSTATLAAMLRRLNLEPGDSRPAIQLWPDLELCEPDVLVESPEMAVVIECKFVGSRLGYYASQLGREWLALARRPVARRYLLAITSDGAAPRVPSLATGDPPTCTAPLVTISEQILQYCALVAAPLPDLAELARAVRWLAWSDLHVHSHALLDEVPGDCPDAAVLREITGVLAELGCVPFARWSYPLDRIPSLPDHIWLCPSSPPPPAPRLWCYTLPPLSAAFTSPWSTR